MAIRYAWTLAFRELARSALWTAQTTRKALATAAPIFATTVAVCTAIPYLYWLLTGRGPWQRLGLSAAVVVDPFPKPALRKIVRDLRATRKAANSP